MLGIEPCANDPKIGSCVAWAIQRLRPVTDAPHLEAELLLAHLLGVARTYVVAHPEAALSMVQVERYREQVGQRAAGVPLPYILGEAGFFGLRFRVTPDVLIPRPETELLVERALEWCRLQPDAVVVDVGTGSGCIAVALAVHAPGIRLYATDSSRAALEVAAANAQLHAVAERIEFRHGDLLLPVPEPVDVVISNPPYVPESEWETLPPSVRHEPRAALISGAEGLDALRRLLYQAGARVKPSGLLAVEIGAGQAAAALALARSAFPGASVRILRDLAGHDRVLEVLGRAEADPTGHSRVILA